LHTYRLAPHSKGDDTRDATEIQEYHRRDPLVMLRRRLAEQNIDFEAIEKAIKAEVETAVKEAQDSPDGSWEEYCQRFDLDGRLS